VSLRSNSTSDTLEAAARPTSFATFTLMGYACIVSDTNFGSGPRQVIVSMFDTATVDAIVYLDWDDAGGAHMALGNYPPGSVGANFASRPSIGDWFHWYITFNNGVSNYKAGWARAQDAYVTVDAGATLSVGSGVPNHLTYGNYSFTDNNSDIRWANLRAWNAALSDNEIAWERFSSVAIRRANLVFDVPGDSATLAEALKDFSGAGATMTQANLSADPDAPPTFDLFHSAQNWGKFAAAAGASRVNPFVGKFGFPLRGKFG